MGSSLLPFLVVLVAGLVYYFYIYEQIEEVILESKYGTLKGFKSLSRDGRSYNSFRSIPFAKPPVGELRFQPPVEIKKWNGVRDATTAPPLCIQADRLWKKIIGQEDCLYLNVFTPKIPKNKGDKLLPVMVFIHGGYYMFGGSDVYKPIYFMDEDVVLVTLHYRLGALGFLSTGDDVVSGNMGMKDQVMALKWVKAAIKEFGGDPNLVTIFGESAGAASAHLHLFSHLSAGLFHRAISQSGTSLCPWSNLEKDTKAQAKKLGELLSCPTGSSESLVKCLRSADANAIVETHKTIFEIFFGPDEIFGPTLEKGKDTSDAFLTTNTRRLYQEGRLSKVPWISGVNSEEGTFLSGPIVDDDQLMERLSANWKTIAPQKWIYNDKPGVSEKILKHYFGTSPKQFTEKDFGKLTQALSDRYFFSCQGVTTRLHSKHAPTYSYYFSRKNANSFGFATVASKGKYPVTLELLAASLTRFVYSKILNWEVRDYGTSHCDELLYMFYTIPGTGISKSSPDYEFSKDIVKLWVTFAKNGYPGKYKGVEWEEVAPTKAPRSMDLGRSGKMIDESFTARMKFWEDLELTPK